jgi:hypothetical protein
LRLGLAVRTRGLLPELAQSRHRPMSTRPKCPGLRATAEHAQWAEQVQVDGTRGTCSVRTQTAEHMTHVSSARYRRRAPRRGWATRATQSAVGTCPSSTPGGRHEDTPKVSPGETQECVESKTTEVPAPIPISEAPALVVRGDSPLRNRSDSLPEGSTFGLRSCFPRPAAIGQAKGTPQRTSAATDCAPEWRDRLAFRWRPHGHQQDSSSGRGST